MSLRMIQGALRILTQFTENFSQSLRDRFHLFVLEGQAAGKVETPAGHPLGDRVPLIPEKPTFEEYRLFMHAPEEGASADLFLRQPAHDPFGIFTDRVLEDQPINPIDI